MSSPASVLRHPIHPMLVAFPIGLWIFSLVSDVIYLSNWGPIIWKDVAFYTMAGGVVGALVAAIPGLIDLFSLSGRPKTLGIWHMIINLIVVLMFAANLWLRLGTAASEALTVPLSFLGVVLLGVSGWLGGEMVYVHGVAVDQGDIEREHIAERAAPRRVA